MNTSSTPNVQMGYTDGTSNRVRPTSLTYPSGRQVVFQYGPSAEIDAKASRIRDLRDSGVDLVQYAYLGENSVVQQTSPEADLEYTLVSLTGSDDPDTGDIYAGLDRFGRIKDLRWRNTSSSTDLARREYGYDRDSNRLWSTDPVDTNSEHDWLLSYDGLQRLKDAERGELNGTHSAISTLDFAQCWTLDATNNWQNFRQNDDGSGGWDLEQERTANTVNEITDITNSTGPTAITPTYDANGNMVTDRSGNHLLYDAWNRLMRVGDPSNTLLQRNDYDARGFLVRKRNYSGGVVSERFENYYTDSWQLIEVRPGTSTTVSEQNVWGLRYIDDLVLRDRDTTGNGTLDERLYCAQGANWNAIAVVDTSGAVQERYSYTPYGEVTFLSPSYSVRSSSDYAWTTLFTGRAWDPVSGFYHFRRREYDPVLGVFLTRDPIEYSDGLNLYAAYFVPNRVDPHGHHLITVGLSGTFTIASGPLPVPGTYFSIEATYETEVFSCKGKDGNVETWGEVTFEISGTANAGKTIGELGPDSGKKLPKGKRGNSPNPSTGDWKGEPTTGVGVASTDCFACPESKCSGKVTAFISGESGLILFGTHAELSLELYPTLGTWSGEVTGATGQLGVEVKIGIRGQVKCAGKLGSTYSAFSNPDPKAKMVDDYHWSGSSDYLPVDFPRPGPNFPVPY